MSRKTLLAILGVLGAVFAFIAKEFGLSIDTVAVTAAIASIIVYIYGEMKLDFERFRSQAHRFSDPKFIIALISVILGAINKNFGLAIPVEAIIAILTVIMGVLFRKEYVKS